MKVILSHPYCGPIYWWFSRDRKYAFPKKPGHSYYASLFGDVDKHLDIALACALIYEEFVLPAADAAYPGLGDLQHISPTDLGLEVSAWDAVHEARKLSDPIKDSWRSDMVLSQLLDKKSNAEVDMELHYAVADVLLAAEHRAPVLCSDGRRALVRRLIELGIVSPDPGVVAGFSSEKSVGEMVDSYARVEGLTFGTDDMRQFADLKWALPLREYADGFQRVLNDPSTQSVDDLYKAIASALESKLLAERVRGAFAATSQVMDLGGLIPGVGTVMSALGLGSDAGAAIAQGRAGRVRWFELSQAVSGARQRSALEAELRSRGLR
jgi:hypothetical protein